MKERIPTTSFFRESTTVFSLTNRREIPMRRSNGCARYAGLCIMKPRVVLIVSSMRLLRASQLRSTKTRKNKQMKQRRVVVIVDISPLWQFSQCAFRLKLQAVSSVTTWSGIFRLLMRRKLTRMICSQTSMKSAGPEVLFASRTSARTRLSSRPQWTELMETSHAVS